MPSPRLFAPLLALLAAGPVAAQDAVPPHLTDYVSKDDGAFAWKLAEKTETPAGTIYTLDLTSQKWHGVVWTHKLQVIVPKGITPKPTMLLFNTGGTPGGSSAAIALALADRIQSPIAFLYGIPNQPIPEIGGNKKEDALIAETFVRYLETKDPTWPLLFPMAKSLVKAMDAIQAFAKQEWKFDVTHFVVSGASKRGWTSWLTAATGDKRVKAIAPMVIDTLNFQKQMPHQLKSFNGKYSEQIHDYEERGLLPLPDTTEAKQLWAMVDPWVYRSKLTLPKLLIHGTNDPYWAQDAMNLYWDDLPGPKWVCYVPNAGHGLRPEDKPNQKGSKMDPFPTQGIDALAAFVRHQVIDNPMPNLTWEHADGPTGPVLRITSDPPAKAIRGFVATSDTRDFRKSRWEPVKSHGQPTAKAELTVTPAAGKFTAFLGEAEYEIGGLRHTVSTQIRVLEPKK
ncbi:MAG: PhoPQ-activated protein PqaA family protein [Gemmataceae bacterium]